MAGFDDDNRWVLIEEATFLADQGVGLEHVARQMKMTAKYLERRLRANGRDDLAETLRTNGESC